MFVRQALVYASPAVICRDHSTSPTFVAEGHGADREGHHDEGHEDRLDHAGAAHEGKEEQAGDVHPQEHDDPPVAPGPDVLRKRASFREPSAQLASQRRCHARGKRRDRQQPGESDRRVGAALMMRQSEMS